MPPAPLIASSGSSLMQLVVMTLLFGGVGIALAAVPAVRGRITQHATQVDQFIRPTRHQTPAATPVAPAAEAAPSGIRREIEEFDLDIFG